MLFFFNKDVFMSRNENFNCYISESGEISQKKINFFVTKGLSQSDI